MVIRKAVLVSFSVRSDMFDSNYERNKFYRGLYGWRQKIKKSYGEYEYYKSGLLDEVPFFKVNKSLFIVACKDIKLITEYIDTWKHKVKYNIFEIILTPQQIKMLEENDVL
ncbi:MAG: hypothetical protein GQ477_00385 [Nanohaloarchaea archaeon]|nr:hypothetical protein [Candidatus Nanohaloarchaea archaeon]